MSGCMSNQYERTYLLEAALNDLRFKERKGTRKNLNGPGAARSTKTSEMRAKNTKRVLKIIKDREDHVFSPARGHKPGEIELYYPTNAINKVLNTKVQ